jgi:aryl-alcohol dehydrogenase-like predicted oxidoreductase
MIKQRTMGRTGLKLSELSLGVLNFGWKTDETRAHAILDAYYAADGNFIQASSWSPELMLPSASTSKSEEIVGRWWTARRIPREKLFLATRVHVRQPLQGKGNFLKVVRQAMQESMRRLRTHYIDMVIFEWNDRLVPMSLTLEAFDLVVRSGSARYIGAANFPVWRVADSIGRAYVGNHNRIEALQTDYSLMTRARFEPEAMALSQEQRLGFFASSPLAGGFLARGRDLEAMFHAVRRERLLERFGNAYGEMAQSAVADVAARHEASSAQIALSWVLHNPVVTSAVIGVNSVAQLSELVHATSLSLSAADLEQLDRATAAEEVRVAPEITREHVSPGERMLN